MSFSEIVTEHETLRLEIRDPEPAFDGAHQYLYEIRVHKEEKIVGCYVIRVTWRLAASDDRFSDSKVERTLLRVILPRLRVQEYSGEISLSRTTVDSLLANH